MLCPGPCRSGSQMIGTFCLPRKSQAVCTWPQSFSSNAMWWSASRLPLHEVRRCGGPAAAQEGEPVLDPVRDAEAEHALIEGNGLVEIGHREGDMAELERADAGHRRRASPVVHSLKISITVPLGSRKLHRARHAGDGVAAHLAGDALGRQFTCDLREIRLRRDLE